MFNYSIPYVRTNINSTTATSLPYVTTPVRIRFFPPSTIEDEMPSWDYGPYGQCGTNCKQTRIAICRYPSGREVPPTQIIRCGSPLVQRSCNYGEGLCVYAPSWRYGQFEDICGTDCKRDREYACEYPDGTLANESLCGAHTQYTVINCGPGEGLCPNPWADVSPDI